MYAIVKKKKKKNPGRGGGIEKEGEGEKGVRGYRHPVGLPT
jgi:hypothetical protein